MHTKEPSIAEMIEREYGIKSSRLHLLGDYWNTTYKVDSDAGGSFVLRIATPSVTSPTPIENEIRWLNYVTAHSDLIVPRPVATLDGRWVTQIEGDDRFCCLFRWIEGESARTRCFADTARQMGRIVGTLHSLSLSYDPPPSVPGPTEMRHRDGDELARIGNMEWLEWLKTNAGISDQDVGMLSSATEIVLSEMKPPTDDPTHFGLTHGDLHLGNFILTPDYMALIDFDQTGWGHFALDLAFLLQDIDTIPPEYGSRRECLAGYREIRSLPFSSEREIDLRVAFLHLLIFDWMHSLKHGKTLDSAAKMIGVRISELRGFMSRNA